MRQKAYCCEASSDLYKNYYLSQHGNGTPIFQGYRGQRGHGLGSILSGFFRSALPIFKQGLKLFGREALRTGAKIATDVADGQSLGDSARSRIRERINEQFPNFISQSGSGKRRRRIKRRRTKRAKKDIFD
jgi:hypothetical protein